MVSPRAPETGTRRGQEIERISPARENYQSSACVRVFAGESVHPRRIMLLRFIARRGAAPLAKQVETGGGHNGRLITQKGALESWWNHGAVGGPV